MFPQAEERFGWASEARTKIITAQATSRAAQVVDEAAETLWFELPLSPAASN